MTSKRPTALSMVGFGELDADRDIGQQDSRLGSNRVEVSRDPSTVPNTTDVQLQLLLSIPS
jgi:hypothetical protein